MRVASRVAERLKKLGNYEIRKDQENLRIS